MADRVPAVIVGGMGSTVTLTRSLGRAGVPVHVLAGGQPTLAGASRFSRSVTHVGAASGIVDRWLVWLEEQGPRGAVLLPSGDEGVELVVRHRNRIEQAGFKLLPSAGETSLAMLDKERTYELARRVGIPTPQTWVVSTGEDVRAIGAQIGYPVALKPVHSHLFSRHFPKVKVLLAEDEDDLIRGLESTAQRGLKMLATEIVPGPERFTWTYSTLLDADGRPLYELTRNKLRSSPIHFGTNCYVETRGNAEVLRIGRQFVHGIGLRGLANVEFKWDAAARTFKLIECNHRFVNAQEVIRRAGIDSAVLAYRYALGEEVGPLPPWREGVRLWWPARDLRAALAYRREGELTLRQWASSLLHWPTYLPQLALDDPGPALLLARRRALRAVRRMRP